MNVNFWGLSWVILGRMTDAREEADVDDDPGEECSARMVERCAMQELVISG